MTLSADPFSNQIMLAVQDDGSDLNFVLWNGSSWGTPVEQETNTGEIKNQPFLFLWDQQAAEQGGAEFCPGHLHQAVRNR